MIKILHIYIYKKVREKKKKKKKKTNQKTKDITYPQPCHGPSILLFLFLRTRISDILTNCFNSFESIIKRK
jgi:hypothetical protein